MPTPSDSGGQIQELVNENPFDFFDTFNNLPPNPPPNSSPRYLGNNKIEQSIGLVMSTFNINLAMKMIPEFNGKPGELHRFIQIAQVQFNRAETAQDKSDFLDVVGTKLVGRAYSIVLRYNEYSDWDSLKGALNTHFARLRAVQMVHSDIFSLKQHASEFMGSYSEKAEKLLDELNIATTRDLTGDGCTAVRQNNEALVLPSYMNGLLEPLRTIILSSCRITLLRAIELSLQQERVVQTRNNLPNTNTYCSVCRTRTHNTKECRRRTPPTQAQFFASQNPLPNFGQNNHQTLLSENKPQINLVSGEKVKHQIKKLRKSKSQ